ncbi:MAG: hypothetical protein L3J49_09970 [Desulfobulbaceae bacterium]|nr:hypothetical protein [Desulfobulbaceae bacterium]
MIQQIFLVFCLLTLLLMPGCAPSPYRAPTPYQRQPTINQGNRTPGVSEPIGQQENPLTRDIRRQAERQIQAGRLDAAAQTLERGLRIAPKDGSFWSQLALIRLQQHRYGQAQSLAAKSINLAGGDSILIRRNQHIIEEAQRALQ